jgi:hypothetical protein
MRNISLQGILDGLLCEVADTYGMPLETLIELVEESFNSVLAGVSGYSVETWIEPSRDGKEWNVTIWACAGSWHEAKGYFRMALGDVSRNAVRLIGRLIAGELQDYALRERFSAACRLRRCVCEGTVSRPRAKDGTLIVDIRQDPPGVFAPPVVYRAFCPPLHQHPRERRADMTGTVRKYMVSRVEMRRDGNGDAAILIEASRTSAGLPEILMRQLCRALGDGRRIIRCLRRYPGTQTVLFSSRPVPRRVMMAVEEAIGEPLYVQLPRGDTPPMFEERGSDRCSV